MKTRADPSHRTKTRGDPRYLPMPHSLHLAKILVPIDFSIESQVAVKYAIAFAKRFRSSLTLLTVVEPPVYTVDVGYGPVTRQCPGDDLLQKAEKKLLHFADEMPTSGLNVRTVVRKGAADVQIADAARAGAYDLIVMGTHSLRGMTSPAGTSERVVRHAPCPVFVVRRKEHEFS